MNLTSKRIIKGLAVCVGACALSATAANTWVTDSFEDPEGAADQAIYTYKAEVLNDGQNTNFLWDAEENDESKLVATDPQGYAGVRPITNVTADLHLQLDTGGGTLKRYLALTAAAEPEWTGQKVADPVEFNAETNVYIDTLIKFTPSDDEPVIDDENVKIAVFVDVNSNLVVYHRTFTNESFTLSTVTNSVTDKIIDPDAWYRLTIRMAYAGDELGVNGCMVYVNQTALTHYNAYDDDANNGGSWFLLASNIDPDQVTQISFQGTGAIDELVVADEADLPAPSAVQLTLSFDDTKVQVWNIDADEAVADAGTVEKGTEIAIEIKPGVDWHEISDVSGAASGSFDGTPAPGALVTATTGTVDAAANDTLTITAQAYSGGTISTALGNDLPANKVAAWAMGQDPALGAGDLEADMFDDYLLNVAPDTDATISITSIEVNGTTATITVAADVGESEEVVNFGAINGTLVVLGTDDLAEAFVEVSSEDFEITEEAATAEIEVDVSTYKFLKAKVK